MVSGFGTKLVVNVARFQAKRYDLHGKGFKGYMKEPNKGKLPNWNNYRSRQSKGNNAASHVEQKPDTT